LEGTVFDMADRCQNVEIIDFLKKLSVSNWLIIVSRFYHGFI
jgi:hypothetical protein